MPHALVTQLVFTRSEFMRGLKGLSEEDASKRLLPMNCISWNVGHLAWQEQRYFLQFAQGVTLFPAVAELYAYGAAACTPSLKEMRATWQAITEAADPWLASLTSAKLQEPIMKNGQPGKQFWGDLLQRVIYHYWYHTGESMAIRQMLGHDKLAQFVGNIDRQAPYHPED